MRPVIKWTGVFVIVTLTTGAAYIANGLRNMHVLYLHSCIQEHAFPGADWACRQALYKFHPTRAEVEEMNAAAGAAWALSITDEAQARHLLQHYIQAGVDVNAVDRRSPGANWTALHIAASSSDLKGVRLLLEAGANASALDIKGRTPLDLVQQRARTAPEDGNYAEIAKALQSAMSKSGALPSRQESVATQGG